MLSWYFLLQDFQVPVQLLSWQRFPVAVSQLYKCFSTLTGWARLAHRQERRLLLTRSRILRQKCGTARNTTLSLPSPLPCTHFLLISWSASDDRPSVPRESVWLGDLRQSKKNLFESVSVLNPALKLSPPSRKSSSKLHCILLSLNWGFFGILLLSSLS